ncbi:MAG: hypothetical protein LWX11_04030 [Firmicutes bacterium]|nr:hypothetical protein [Bacillota bacterium]
MSVPLLLFAGFLGQEPPFPLKLHPAVVMKAEATEEVPPAGDEPAEVTESVPALAPAKVEPAHPRTPKASKPARRKAEPKA